jgi:hypothetical protein
VKGTKYKVYTFFIIIVMLLSCNIQQSIATTQQKFKDVSPSYWAYSDIEWAVSNNLLSLYPDKTFKPKNQITEAQLAIVMCRYFNPDIETEKSEKDVTAKYYRYLESKGVLLPGHSKKSLRNLPINRIELAKAIATSQDMTGTPNQIVDWMYTNQFVFIKKKSTDKYVAFGGNDSVIRSEVAAIFKRMSNYGMTTIITPRTKPITPTDPTAEMVIPKGPLYGYALVKAMEPIALQLGFKDYYIAKATEGYDYMSRGRRIDPEEALKNNFRFSPMVSTYTIKDTEMLLDVIETKDKVSYDFFGMMIQVYGADIYYKDFSTKVYNFMQQPYTKPLTINTSKHTIVVSLHQSGPISACYIKITKK